MDVEPFSPGRGLDRDRLVLGEPARGETTLVFRMNSIRKDHAFIGFKPVEQGFIGLDMGDLRRLVRAHGKRFGFPVAKSKSLHQLDRTGLRRGNIERRQTVVQQQKRIRAANLQACSLALPKQPLKRCPLF